MKTKILLKVLFLSSFMFLKSGVVFADEVYEDVCLEESNANTNQGKTYKVGDKGPAGGIIFLTPSCEGNETGLYFEAAPKILDKQIDNLYISPALSTSIVFKTGSDIGEGIINTKTIIDNFDNVSAAHYCYNLKTDNIGNITTFWDSFFSFGCNSTKYFKDWFLPSKYELAAMKTNLFKKGLGYFVKNSDYLSSSHYVDISYARYSYIYNSRVVST
jgi:hypothetical protein